MSDNVPSTSPARRPVEPLIQLIGKIEKRYKIGSVDGPGLGFASPPFTELMDEAEKRLEQEADAFKRNHENLFYKFLGIQAETKEYFDTATAGYRLDLYYLAQGLSKDLYKRLGGVAPIAPEEQKTLKNIIRVLVAGLEHLYSIDDYSTGIIEAQRLHDLVMLRLVSRETPSYGTRATLQYFLGRNYRQRGMDDDYQKAIDCFYQASELYFERARRVEKTSSDEISEDVIYARTRAMVSLGLGAGFLFYTARSDLGKAKALVAPARLAFLRDNAQICCALHYYYLDLLFASILRAEAGELRLYKPNDPKRGIAQEKLNHALAIIEECEKQLVNKKTHLVHALFHKGLLFLYLGPDYYPRARECVQRLFDLSDHPRWQANALVLKSHLEKREQKFDLALEDAIKAYGLAANHLPVRIEALLARGQAQLGREQFDAARADFQRVLGLIDVANFKIRAAALLLLVETALAQQNEHEARERLNDAKPIMINIGHGYLKNRFDDLTEQVEALQSDFFIAGNQADLDYRELDSKLQKWLLKRVSREERNLTRAARRLQVSKKTIYKWMKDHDIKLWTGS